MACWLEAEQAVGRRLEMPAISLRGVSMVYAAGGSEGRIHALQSVDLDVASGEFVSLIGPSGCGKSTLLRLIGDLLAPTSGSIQVNGKAPRQARLSADGHWLAYVSDETGIREVYIQRFPNPGGHFQISSGGGAEPVWGRKSTELTYRGGAALMSGEGAATRGCAPTRPLPPAAR